MSNRDEIEAVTVNGREYFLPRRPTVVLTVDGGDPSYFDEALERGVMPRLRRMLDVGGSYHLGLGHMPSLTNPNNLSIVTGTAPAIHGLPGNHYLDTSGEEVQLDDPRFLRAPTVLSAMREVGQKVLAVTAKDKLRRLLASGGVPSISVEKAGEQRLPAFGIDDLPALIGRAVPAIYDWDASHCAMEVALAVHRRAGLDLLYVSLTDFVQHKEGPGEPMADRFYRRFDALLGEYLDEGFVVGITADHGMNAKHEPDGSPRVHYLEDVLEALRIPSCRVVLPITDPHVVHHGALGSFAWVHLPGKHVEAVRNAFTELRGVEEIYTREEAAVIFEHPADRIGDLSICSDARTALGKSRAKHDLSGLKTGLRSHGGRHEQIVPLIVSEPLREPYASRHRAGARSSDIYELVLNGVA